MKGIIKKTDYCSNCGYLDTNSYCRVGLGWKYIKHPKSTSCGNQIPIKPKRCGTCYWYILGNCDTDSTTYVTCMKTATFTDFFDCCPFYEHEIGKNIRPKADEIPLIFKQYGNNKGRNSGKM